jgi:hypothetical protein
MSMCPGCGLEVSDPRLPHAARYNAAAECLAQFHELSAIQLSESDPAFVHQIAVDCYGAQHTGCSSQPLRCAGQWRSGL